MHILFVIFNSLQTSLHKLLVLTFIHYYIEFCWIFFLAWKISIFISMYGWVLTVVSCGRTSSMDTWTKQGYSEFMPWFWSASIWYLFYEFKVVIWGPLKCCEHSRLGVLTPGLMSICTKSQNSCKLLSTTKFPNWANRGKLDDICNTLRNISYSLSDTFLHWGLFCESLHQK